MRLIVVRCVITTSCASYRREVRYNDLVSVVPRREVRYNDLVSDIPSREVRYDDLVSVVSSRGVL